MNEIRPIRVTTAKGWPPDMLQLVRNLIDPDAPDLLFIGQEVSDEEVARCCAEHGIKLEVKA